LINLHDVFLGDPWTYLSEADFLSEGIKFNRCVGECLSAWMVRFVPYDLSNSTGLDQTKRRQAMIKTRMIIYGLSRFALCSTEVNPAKKA
jgi:hypothetical protein